MNEHLNLWISNRLIETRLCLNGNFFFLAWTRADLSVSLFYPLAHSLSMRDYVLLRLFEQCTHRQQLSAKSSDCFFFQLFFIKCWWFVNPMKKFFWFFFLPNFDWICCWWTYRRLANPSMKSTEIGRLIRKKQSTSYHSGFRSSAYLFFGINRTKKWKFCCKKKTRKLITWHLNTCCMMPICIESLAIESRHLAHRCSVVAYSVRYGKMTGIFFFVYEFRQL